MTDTLPAQDHSTATFPTDEATIERYTHRDCWMLTHELNRRTVWPIVALADEVTDHGFGWFHVLVARPDGKLVDILGTQTADEVADQCDGFGSWDFYDVSPDEEWLHS